MTDYARPDLGFTAEQGVLLTELWVGDLVPSSSYEALARAAQSLRGWEPEANWKNTTLETWLCEARANPQSSHQFRSRPIKCLPRFGLTGFVDYVSLVFCPLPTKTVAVIGKFALTGDASGVVERCIRDFTFSDEEMARYGDVRMEVLSHNIKERIDDLKAPLITWMQSTFSEAIHAIYCSSPQFVTAEVYVTRNARAFAGDRTERWAESLGIDETAAWLSHSGDRVSVSEDYEKLVLRVGRDISEMPKYRDVDGPTLDLMAYVTTSNALDILRSTVFTVEDEVLASSGWMPRIRMIRRTARQWFPLHRIAGALANDFSGISDARGLYAYEVVPNKWSGPEERYPGSITPDLRQKVVDELSNKAAKLKEALQRSSEMIQTHATFSVALGDLVLGVAVLVLALVSIAGPLYSAGRWATDQISKSSRTAKGDGWLAEKAQPKSSDDTLVDLFGEFKGRLVTPVTAAQLLGLSKQTIHTLGERKKLRVFKGALGKGGRAKWIFIPLDDVVAYGERLGKKVPKLMDVGDATVDEHGRVVDWHGDDEISGRRLE